MFKANKKQNKVKVAIFTSDAAIEVKVAITLLSAPYKVKEVVALKSGQKRIFFWPSFFCVLRVTRKNIFFDPITVSGSNELRISNQITILETLFQWKMGEYFFFNLIDLKRGED